MKGLGSAIPISIDGTHTVGGGEHILWYIQLTEGLSVRWVEVNTSSGTYS